MQQVGQQLSPFRSAIRWVSMVLAAVAAATLGVMMFISVADVVGRYFFIKPIEGASELVGILLVVVGSAGLGWCQLAKGNIRINVISDRFPRKGQSALYIFSYILCIVISVLIVWQGTLQVVEYMHKQLGGVTSILAIPFWPFQAFMVLGFAWVVVIFVIDIFDSFIEVFKK